MVRSLPALAMLPVLTVGSAAGLAGTSRTSPRVALPQAFSVRVAPTWVSPSAVVLIQVEQPSTFDPQHPQGVHYSIVAEATVRPTSTSVAVPDSALLSSIAHKTQGRLNFIAETLNEATNAVAVQNFTTTLAGAPVVRLSVDFRTSDASRRGTHSGPGGQRVRHRSSPSTTSSVKLWSSVTSSRSRLALSKSGR